jgi:uncharacterized protein
MNFAEIRRTLETASPLPEEELRAALAHTDELLPLVVALIDKLKAGVYLLPDQQWLLVYGIHVLAAARKTAFWPAWRDLLRLPDAVATLFGENAVPVIAAVTLSLAGDDADEIFALLDTGPEGEPGAAGFQVLARMTWDGRIPLARSRAFLEYFEQEECAAPDDSVWVGWVDAVVLLGLTELAPAIARVLAKPVFDDLDPADRTETLAMLAAAAGDFADGDRFLAEGIAPFADPVEGLAWLRASTILETPASAPDADEVPDPAAAIRLSGDEEIWLSGFLDSEQAPATTMNLEALDGFFSALAAGPAPIPAAEYLPLIWGSAAAGRKPAYADAAQQTYVERCRRALPLRRRARRRARARLGQRLHAGRGDAPARLGAADAAPQRRPAARRDDRALRRRSRRRADPRSPPQAGREPAGDRPRHRQFLARPEPRPGAADPHREDRPQRSLPVRLGQEIQEMLRGGRSRSVRS